MNAKALQAAVLSAVTTLVVIYALRQFSLTSRFVDKALLG